MIDLANRARRVQPQAVAAARIADGVNALPGSRALPSKAHGVDTLRNRVQGDHGHVAHRVAVQHLALNRLAVLYQVEVVLALGDQLVVLAIRREKHQHATVFTNDVVVRDDELLFQIDERAGAHGQAAFLARRKDPGGGPQGLLIDLFATGFILGAGGRDGQEGEDNERQHPGRFPYAGPVRHRAAPSAPLQPTDNRNRLNPHGSRISLHFTGSAAR